MLGFPSTPPPSRFSNDRSHCWCQLPCPSCPACWCCWQPACLRLRLLRLTPHAGRGTSDSVQFLQSLRFGDVGGCSGDRGRGRSGREFNGGICGVGCGGVAGEEIAGDVMVTMGGVGKGSGEAMMERMEVRVARGVVGGVIMTMGGVRGEGSKEGGG